MRLILPYADYPKDARAIHRIGGQGHDGPFVTINLTALPEAQIESELFKFEHLFVLDPQAMGALLREVDSDLLIDALKGIDETQREVFFRAMSSRAADGLKDEIETRGRLKFADVDAAQKRIIEVAKRLIADGTIILGDGDEDYV